MLECLDKLKTFVLANSRAHAEYTHITSVCLNMEPRTGMQRTIMQEYKYYVSRRIFKHSVVTYFDKKKYRAGTNRN